jgi:hypothetical protein
LAKIKSKSQQCIKFGIEKENRAITSAKVQRPKASTSQQRLRDGRRRFQLKPLSQSQRAQHSEIFICAPLIQLNPRQKPAKSNEPSGNPAADKTQTAQRRNFR